MGQHWMTFVRWATIAAWKQRVRAATGDEGDFPYQYSSDNVRFLQIRPRDVLWLVTTPRFAQPDNPKMPGRARPPAVMARLRVAAMCCNVHNEQRRVDRGELPVCLESCLRSCEAPGVLDAGVHPASDAWSIVAIGEKEPATYPALYNMFGVLDRLEFATRRGPTDLRPYLEFVAAGDYLTPAQRKARKRGKPVPDPGPYSALGQWLQTLRKLTPASARVMDEFHRRAVKGKRVFFSYSWDDVEQFAAALGQSRAEWIRELDLRLDEAGYNSWLDVHQILASESMSGLLDEVLADAVHQSVVFVALLSPRYGSTHWTRDEWDTARKQMQDPRRRHKLVQILLQCGGDPGALDIDGARKASVARPPRPEHVLEAIEQLLEAQPGSGATR